MEWPSVLIEIKSLRYPLRLHGRVAQYDWHMFATGDTWVFYICDIELWDHDHLWYLSAKLPAAEQMPPQLAIRIADACAKKFAKILSTVEVPA